MFWVGCEYIHNNKLTNLKSKWEKLIQGEQTKLPAKVKQNGSYTGSTQQTFKQKSSVPPGLDFLQPFSQHSLRRWKMTCNERLWQPLTLINWSAGNASGTQHPWEMTSKFLREMRAYIFRLSNMNSKCLVHGINSWENIERWYRITWLGLTDTRVVGEVSSGHIFPGKKQMDRSHPL